MDPIEELSKILMMPKEAVLAAAPKELLEKVWLENGARISRTLKALGKDTFDAETMKALRETALAHDAELKKYVDTMPGANQFDKAAHLAREVARVGKGFFLKHEFAANILRARPPQHLLEFFGYASVDELLSKHDVTDAFSALRFMESDQWMHETFDAAYSNFSPTDFEERDIELKVLGPEWLEVAKKFVEKKHHNVSHLKEFGVIFLNPVADDVPATLLRNFALLFHYFHEVEFYSKMFRKYAAEPNFNENFKALLRGDVKDASAAKAGEWLIVQRYFWKLDPKDARLFIPRVNPESLHWRRGEMDIAHYAASHNLPFNFWEDLDWVGFRVGDQTASLDLVDNAMAAVSLGQGKDEFLNYHQREAIWTKIFSDLVGGEDAMEKILMDHFAEGVVKPQ